MGVKRPPRLVLALLVFGGCAVMSWAGLALSTGSVSADVGPAAEFLRHQMDITNDVFWVYSDESMSGNHFPVLCLLTPPAVVNAHKPLPINVCTHWTANPQSPPECIRSEVTHGDAGACLQHGYMEPDDTTPRPNWGDRPDAGTDLSQAHYLTFYARGERGGERAEFFVGGIGRDPGTGLPELGRAFPDIPKISTGVVQLGQRWQRFSIPLPANTPRKQVIAGLAWWQWANPDGGPSVIFLDSAWYDWARPREPRLPASFAIETSDQEFDQVQRGFAHVYDSALAEIAFLALDDVRHARLIADALCYAVENDPDGNWIQGGIRNCYSAGDSALPAGWLPTGRPAAARLAGFWHREGDAEHPDGVWYQDEYANAVYVGNIAWAGIALCHVARVTGDEKYLKIAKRLGHWIISHARAKSGFRGGMDYWAKQATPVPWTSTEHCIDSFVLFTLLAGADPANAAGWSDEAQHAREFVERMWDDTTGHFWTGLTDTGEINQAFIPVDVQAWAVLALRDPRYTRALDWAISNCTVGPAQHQLPGFAFRDVKQLAEGHPAKGLWPEGTSQMVCALRQAGRAADAESYLATLQRLQGEFVAEGKQGMVASTLPVLEAQPPEPKRRFEYFRRQHVGATAWFVFAELGANPYWLPNLYGGG